MAREKTARRLRLVRHARVRKTVLGTTERPRLCVFRSLNHIHAQIIDDTMGHTLVSASTLEPDGKRQEDRKSKSERSRLVGTTIAQRALKNGITKIVFDRGGYKYHGRVKALAEAAREGGLAF